MTTGGGGCDDEVAMSVEVGTVDDGGVEEDGVDKEESDDDGIEVEESAKTEADENEKGVVEGIQESLCDIALLEEDDISVDAAEPGVDNESVLP